jgi:hypothetical protein
LTNQVESSAKLRTVCSFYTSNNNISEEGEVDEAKYSTAVPLIEVTRKILLMTFIGHKMIPAEAMNPTDQRSDSANFSASLCFGDFDFIFHGMNGAIPGHREGN